MTQLVLEKVVLLSKEVEGVEMGVLSDGTPFLTQRGLARVCGVVPAAITQAAQKWNEGSRTGKLASILQAIGASDLYVQTKHNGRVVNAYTDDICTAFLEYHAFENNSPVALGNYRSLARRSLREVIYAATGYDPRLMVPPAWRQYHDRLQLNVAPAGHFSVFREMADLVLTAIQGGLTVDSHTVPDISVGRIWSDHWTKHDLAARFGERMKYEHNYPDYFPQSDSNPQSPWAYPLAALGEFRQWIESTYLPEKFPAYLDGKVRSSAITDEKAKAVLAAVAPRQLGAG